MYFYGYRQHQPHAFINKLNKLNTINFAPSRAILFKVNDTDFNKHYDNLDKL